MSSEAIDFVNTVDHKFRVFENQKPTFQLKKGIRGADYRCIPSIQGGSQTGSSYSITLNQNCCVSDYFIEECQFTVTLNLKNGNTGADRPFLPGNIAPRQFPLHNISQNVAININGKTVNCNCQDILNPLSSFNKPIFSSRDLPCASELDRFADLPVPAIGSNVWQYPTTNTQAVKPVFDTTVGSLRNAMGDYNMQTLGFQPRFSDMQIDQLDNTQIAQDANGSYIFKFTTREPIWTGATSISLMNSSAFSGVTSISITRNYVNNIVNRLINYLPKSGWTANSISVEVGTPNLYYVVYSTDDSYVAKYPMYHEIVDYGTKNSFPPTNMPVGGVPNMQKATFTTASMSLGLIPEAIYLWVAVPNNDPTKNYTASDAPGYAIENISISYNNKSGQFSSMLPVHLYTEFMASQGSVIGHNETRLCNTVHPIGDVGLATEGLYGHVLRIPGTALDGIDWNKYSVGSAFNANLIVSVTATNLHKNANAPYLFIQVINKNVLSITGPTSAQLFEGLLTPDEVQKVRSSGLFELAELPMLGGGRDMYARRKPKARAGAFWDKVKHLGKLAYDNRDTIAKVGKTAMPLLGLGKKKKSKRRLYGGAMNESSEEDSNDSNNEWETDEEDEQESYRGGSIISKKKLQLRLK